MAINWDEAPDGATHYAGGDWWIYNCLIGWQVFDAKVGNYLHNGVFPLEYADYTARPKEWPETDERISAIAQNGGTGEHYEAVKHDAEKPMYNLLPPVAIDLMAQVMTFGAKKYKPEGWRTVPDAIPRYQAALLRHSFSMLRGEVIDQESGLPHAAHAMCCAAFLAELQGA